MLTEYVEDSNSSGVNEYIITLYQRRRTTISLRLHINTILQTCNC